MTERAVIPEILDGLPSDDPRAIRSRQDLRFINSLMGNYRWIVERIRDVELGDPHAWVELGAGDGRLCDGFRPGEVEDIRISGLDFAPRPEKWPLSWPWHQGDVFAVLRTSEKKKLSEGLVANLFLHHFKEPELREMGKIVDERFTHILFSEPARYRIFHFLGYALFPFVNAVTRHDMQISIGAGFRPGELAAVLGLGPEWKCRESVTLLGAYRFEAWKE